MTDPSPSAGATHAASSATRVARGLPPHLARAGATAVALAVPVALLAWAVRAEASAVVDLDEAAIRAATDLTRSEPALRTALLAWQEAFQARWVNLAGVLLAVWVWRRHGLRARTAWAVATVLVAWGLSNVVKLAVQRTRPLVDDAVAHAPGYSFPSGHAMNTTAAAIALTTLVWPLLGRRGRAVAVTVAALAVVLTGVDRVMLGVHYPSDVVAGAFLGGAVAVGSWIGWSGHVGARDAAGRTGADLPRPTDGGAR